LHQIFYQLTATVFAHAPADSQQFAVSVGRVAWLKWKQCNQSDVSEIEEKEKAAVWGCGLF